MIAAKTRPGLALAVMGCLLTAAGACGSSGGHADADAADTAGTLDGATGDAAPGDGMCNPLTQLGAPVTAVCDSGAPPAATGGAIADGTYVLTESHFFGACSNGVLTETVVVSNGTVQSITTEPDGTTQAKTVTYTLGQNPTTLVETQTCPSRITTTVRFDATPTTLTIFLTTALATRVSTFVLQ